MTPASSPERRCEIIAILHRPAGLKAKRLVLAGGGKRDKFDSAELRKLTGAVFRSLKSKGIRSITLALDDAFRSDDFAAAAVEGAVLADFEKDRYKTDPKKNEKHVDSFAVLGGSQAAVDRGRILAEAQNFTRESGQRTRQCLDSHAAGRARPRRWPTEFGLDCEILDQDRMRQLGMGALLGVAQGSAEPPALIVIRYQPANRARFQGSSGTGRQRRDFRHRRNLHQARPRVWRRCATTWPAARPCWAPCAPSRKLKPSIPVTALIPTVENMPGSKAQRPGDIVTSLSGKTVEVLNTDAEGRLILIDALTYAAAAGLHASGGCRHIDRSGSGRARAR